MGHLVGFVFPLMVPLAVSAVDFVAMISGLAAAILLIAGWYFFKPIHDALGKISIFGFHPFGALFGFIINQITNLASPLDGPMRSLARFLYSIGATVWRFVYVAVVLYTNAIAGINHNTQGIAGQINQLKTKEQNDINNLNDKVFNDNNRLETEIYTNHVLEQAYIDAQLGNLQNAEDAKIAAVQAELNRLNIPDIGGLQTQINNLQSELTADNLGQTNALNTAVSTLNTTINRDVTDLQGQINAGVGAAEAFALQALGLATPGIIAQAVGQLAPRIAGIETEITQCLDPLCADVAPNAPRLGRNLRWLKNLEALGFEAAIFALAAECLTNPRAVVDDVSSTVHEVGDVVMDAGKALVGL